MNRGNDYPEALKTVDFQTGQCLMKSATRETLTTSC
jgi:hypothetical protein